MAQDTCGHTQFSDIYLTEVVGTTIRVLHATCADCGQHISVELTDDQYLSIIDCFFEGEK